MAASGLEHGHGSALWEYWTKGGGLAKWSGAVHKWTALRDLLLAAGVPAHSADGLATNIIMAVMPGYMKLAHAKGRSGMDARFNPNHAPAGAGGGQFTSGGGGGGGSSPKAPAAKAPHAKAPAHAAKAKHHAALPAVRPNGLGYTDAQWRQLQQWEADHKAGKKLGAHQLHALHEAHLKHAAALAGKGMHAQAGAHKAHAARLAHAAAAAKKMTPGGHKAGRSAMAAETSLSITLNAPGADPATVGEQVIGAIQAYERAAKAPYGDVPYADPGYLDADGNQASKSGKPGVKRYPLSADKVMGAWTYINQADNASQYTPDQLAAIKGRIKSAMAKHGHMVSDTDGDMNSAEPVGEGRFASRGDGTLIRSVPFEVTRARGGQDDGLTLEGYAAVFNRTALIPDHDGDFEEQIAPGAFADSLARKTPVLMFEHGKHPLIGSMPLGKITDAHEDERGLFISARLSDNWLIQPVRDAVRDGAVDGMSFRFTSPGKDDQQWERRSGQPDLRTLRRLSCPELGPVVFPAYEPTTAAVRSLLDGLDEDFTGLVTARSGPGREHDVRPGNGAASPVNRTALRDRAWRMREIR